MRCGSQATATNDPSQWTGRFASRSRRLLDAGSRRARRSRPSLPARRLLDAPPTAIARGGDSQSAIPAGSPLGGPDRAARAQPGVWESPNRDVGRAETRPMQLLVTGSPQIAAPVVAEGPTDAWIADCESWACRSGQRHRPRSLELRRHPGGRGGTLRSVQFEHPTASRSPVKFRHSPATVNRRSRDGSPVADSWWMHDLREKGRHRR